MATAFTLRVALYHSHWLMSIGLGYGYLAYSEHLGAALCTCPFCGGAPVLHLDRLCASHLSVCLTFHAITFHVFRPPLFNFKLYSLISYIIIHYNQHIQGR